MDVQTVSQARRVLKSIDDLIVLLADDSFLTKVPYKYIEVVENNLRQSHTATTNILVNFGDMDSYPLPAPRSKEHEHD